MAKFIMVYSKIKTCGSLTHVTVILTGLINWGITLSISAAGITESDQGLAMTNVSVTFHVLVQLSAWNWDDKSFMTIRFGDPRLGGWDNDTGILDIKR